MIEEGDQFQVLDPLDFIKHNPNMYCGSSYNPIHLFKEIIDNPIDLLLENKVSIIAINNFKDGRFCVVDNGPGFPRIQVKLPDGSYEDSVVASLTKPHSGSKFNAKVAQHGQNGVGTMVVNALSKKVVISVRNFNNKSKIFTYLFKDAKFVSMIEEDDPNTWSTKFEFEVNPKFFETIIITDEIIIDRLNLIKSRHPKCRLFYNDTEITTSSLEEFARHKLRLEDETPIFEINNKDCVLFFTYDLGGSKSPSIYGDINLNICDGQFTSTVMTLYVNVVNTFIDNEKITKSEILNHFRAYISLNVVNARFDSQTKTRMVSNVSSQISVLRPRLTEIVTGTKFFKDHFSLLLEAKSIQTAAKVLKTKKTRVSSDNPLKDCAKVPGKTLYLLEGDSAEGTLKQIRDTQVEAIFPLSGKIMNAIDKSIDKAIESKKIKYLLEAIGVDLTKKNQTAFRYEKVKILADADSVAAETEIVYINKDNLITVKQIKDIDKNDIDSVISLNKVTNKAEIKKVLDVIKHDYDKGYINKITTLGSYEPLYPTDDHVIYVYNINTKMIEETSPLDIDINIHYLVRSSQITSIIDTYSHESTIVINDDFEAIKIKKIERIDYNYDHVYDLEVKDNNNFACTRSGFILHNSDGLHIIVLAVVALWKYAPSLVSNRQVSMLLPPLYGAVKKKEFIPIYNYSDVDIYAQKGYTITRFKGLGEMNPDQLAEVIYNKPVEYVIEPPSTPREGEMVVMCLTDSIIKREICKNGHIGLAAMLKNLSILKNN